MESTNQNMDNISIQNDNSLDDVTPFSELDNNNNTWAEDSVSVASSATLASGSC